MNAGHRTRVEDRPARGITRVFPNTYEVNAFGQPVAHTDQARWARGELVRMSQPAFRLAANYPQYDPSFPAGWVPGSR